MQTLPSITYVEKESKIVFECVSIIPACACKRNVIFHRLIFDKNKPRAFLLSTKWTSKIFPFSGSLRLLSL